MSTRVHTTDATSVGMSLLTGSVVNDLYGFDDPLDADAQVLVLEDPMNMEAWVLVGDDDELAALGDDIRERVFREHKWDDDLLQFARLLDEIRATQENLDYKALCESMDLEEPRIDELFDRAMSVFERSKADLRDQEG